MADLNRSETDLSIYSDEIVKKKHTRILINERINQIRQLEVNLERLKTIDMKKVELSIDVLRKEIKTLENELGEKIIEAEPSQ